MAVLMADLLAALQVEQKVESWADWTGDWKGEQQAAGMVDCWEAELASQRVGKMAVRLVVLSAVPMAVWKAGQKVVQKVGWWALAPSPSSPHPTPLQPPHALSYTSPSC